MPKLSSAFVFAAGLVAAGAMVSSVSAASIRNNVSVGNSTGGGHVTPTPHHVTPPGGPKQKPKPQTDQGGCHTTKTSIQRCYDR